MKTSELVLNFLRSQGFCPEVEDNGNIYFKFQMRNFLYINNDEDNDFFQLLMPAIYEINEDNRDVALEAANKVNSGMKVAKASVINDNVWLFFEILLDQSPAIEDIFPRALEILQAAQQRFYQEIG